MRKFLQLIRPFRETRNIVALCLALFLCAGSLWAQTTITWSAANQGYENSEVIESVVFDDNVTGEFFAGTNSNAPKYYNTGSAIRCYGGNYFTISTSLGNLTEIVITFGQGDGSNDITTDVGDYTNGTWSGEAQSVTFTIGGTTGHRRFASFEITYVTSATSVAMPTFSPASGTTFGDEGLSVTISQANNKPVYYTIDGTAPTSNSTLYTGAITLTSTTTIKAIAYDGNNASNVATATYTYIDPNTPGTENNPYTVAQARAAIDGNGSTQGVYATGIVSAIPYAYTSNNGITFNMVDNNGDAEFLQAYKCKGTEAPNVTVGDVVVVYGNLTKYNSTYEFGQNCQVVSLTHPSGYVAAPTFSPAAGTYTEPQTVTLSCETSGASIYYTLDGSEPDNESTLYTAAINVTTTTTINAIAYVGGNASDVATATYAIASLANISDIDLTEGGNAYEIQGTVVATNSRGFVMGDGTGYVYYYKNGTVTQSVGDMVTISGTTGTYGHIIQFTNTATVAEATSSNYDYTPAATLITEVPDYTQGYHLSTYLEFEGELTKKSSNYFISVGGDTIQISYPTTAQGDTLTAFNGMTVHVKGYFAGINSSGKFTTMLESVEGVAGTDTTISVATLPFVFNGGKDDIDTTDGLTQDGLGSYTSAANATTPLKFDNTGDWLLLHFNEQPGILTFDITGNSFSGGTFTVQTSVDGETYSDLASYDELGTTTKKEINNIGEDVRYIKWIYTNKVSGNVGLGSITLDEPSTAPTILLDEEEIAVGYEGGEGNITVTYLNMGDAPTASVEFYEEDGESFAEYDWITAEIDAENNIHYTVAANEGVARTAYMKVYGITTNFGDEAYSHLITVAQAAAPQQHTLTISEIENLEIFTFVDDLDELALEGAGTITVTEGAAVSLSVSADEGYVLSSLMVDGQSVLSQLDETGLYTFEMPDHNVIVTASAIEDVPGEWVLTSIEDLTENDVFVIVETKDGVSHAMANDNGAQNPPAADTVTVVGNTLSGDVPVKIQWNISVSDSGYVFYPNGNAESWLYCNNTNNGVRVGTGANKFFIMDTTGYLINTGTGRYIGVYLNNPDWRCYTSINSNIVDQTFAFYKKVASSTDQNQTIALNNGTNWVSFNVEITLNDLKAALVEAAPTAQIQIVGQNSQTTYNPNNHRWTGNLTFNMASMYKIKVNSACEITLQGVPVDPADHPYAINQGNNWIAFPLNQDMTLADAFAGFAVQGDQLNSQTGGSVYARRWQGSVSTLQSGKGYVYKAASGSRTLVFPTSAR